MIRQEKRINNIDRRVSTLETTFNMLMQEMRDFKTEMRDRDNQRAEEIREIRQRQDAAQVKHDADMREIRTSIDGMGKHVRNLSVATIIGVGTIAITVIYSILTR